LKNKPIEQHFRFPTAPAFEFSIGDKALCKGIPQMHLGKVSQKRTHLGVIDP
jgi:hypothetical protein